MAKIDLYNLTFSQLTDLIKEFDLPAYRARQIFQWLYRPNITDFEQMSNLSKDLRVSLAAQTSFERLEPVKVEQSSDGTVKYAFKLVDNEIIESVLIPEEDRYTLCISSQVGCAMGCGFCLTGTMGIKRNLTPGEIVGQIIKVRDMMSQHFGEDARINSLVFMGMGEPLANFENLLHGLEIITDQNGLDFSGRRITVSTCGIVPKIKELGKRTKVNLAVSLHSVDDRIRSQLMPINKKYPVNKLLEACRDFPMPKRKRIMFEYIMIKDINDSVVDAEQLAAKLKGIPCKINLLPYNETNALSYQRPSDEHIELFQKTLWKAGFTVLIRTSRGADISAACGQLVCKTNI
jgi:23S rRNA (adenine2503-C2)-methyltransferase